MTPKKSRQSKRAEKPRDLCSRKAIAAWQVDHIREGLRQADAGEFAGEAEMKKAFSRRRKCLRIRCG
jgi:predicted transcriptional regulator